MKNCSCIKCSAKTIYLSSGKGSQYALKTGDGQPLLGIYKDAKWFPDVDFCQMTSYVCRTCGYFEMYVEDLERLKKLEDCDNWQKIEEN